MAENNSVSIRRAQPDDIGEIASCVKRAYRPYVARLGILPAPALEDYARVLQDREVWVTEASGVISGVLVLGQTSEGFLLDNVAVSPEAQGQGLGRDLLQLAERRACECGHPSIYLYTNTAMTENLELYNKVGYREHARRIDGNYSRIYLRKRLG